MDYARECWYEVIKGASIIGTRTAGRIATFVNSLKLSSFSTLILGLSQGVLV